MSVNRSTLLATTSAAIALSLVSIEPVAAEIILPGRCYQGNCYETLFQSKTLVRQGTDGDLYAVETANRWFRFGSTARGDFESVGERYVYCSTSRPAYISPESPDHESYRISFLNPGGNTVGAFMSAHSVYWVTCHNFVGPNFFSEQMTTRAIQLGYSTNLRENQVIFSNLQDFLD